MFSSSASANASSNNLPSPIETEDTRLLYCMLIISLVVQLCGFRLLEFLVKFVSWLFSGDIEGIPVMVCRVAMFFVVLWYLIEYFTTGAISWNWWLIPKVIVKMICKGMSFYFSEVVATLMYYASWIFMCIGTVFASNKNYPTLTRFCGSVITISAVAFLVYDYSVNKSGYVSFAGLQLENIQYVIGDAGKGAKDRCKLIVCKTYDIKPGNFDDMPTLVAMCQSVSVAVTNFHTTNTAWTNRNEQYVHLSTTIQSLLIKFIEGLEKGGYDGEVAKLKEKLAQLEADRLKSVEIMTQVAQDAAVQGALIGCCNNLTEDPPDVDQFWKCWYRMCDDAGNLARGTCKAKKYDPPTCPEGGLYHLIEQTAHDGAAVGNGNFLPSGTPLIGARITAF